MHAAGIVTPSLRYLACRRLARRTVSRSTLRAQVDVFPCDPASNSARSASVSRMRRVPSRRSSGGFSGLAMC